MLEKQVPSKRFLLIYNAGIDPGIDDNLLVI